MSIEFTSNTYGFNWRNRVINGDMRINQRSAGAQSISGAWVYPCDQYYAHSDATVTATIAQSTTAPPGFINSICVAVTTGATNTSGQYARIKGVIEGSNVADLGWGATGAQTVTLSFWVRSSLTGQFGGSIENGAENRSYPFAYTITAANTWQRVAITIPGDTAGTWTIDTSLGIELNWDLGCGSSFLGAANTWAGANYRGATGDTNVLQSGASWYLTGVQLEVGQVATPYEHLPYTLEVALCQRVYEVIDGWVAYVIGSTSLALNGTYKVSKRTAPTLSLSLSNPTVVCWGGGNFTGSGCTIVATYLNTSNGFNINIGGFSGLGGNFISDTGGLSILASAEL